MKDRFQVSGVRDKKKGIGYRGQGEKDR